LEIWSAKLVEKFYASTVLSAISNTDYEGRSRISAFIKPGELSGNSDRVMAKTISSQVADVRETPGLRKVQRLGGEETILRPRAPGFPVRDDEIVSSARKLAGR
jgi:hypothetical protein